MDIDRRTMMTGTAALLAAAPTTRCSCRSLVINPSLLATSLRQSVARQSVSQLLGLDYTGYTNAPWGHRSPQKILVSDFALNYKLLEPMSRSQAELCRQTAGGCRREG